MFILSVSLTVYIWMGMQGSYELKRFHGAICILHTGEQYYIAGIHLIHTILMSVVMRLTEHEGESGSMYM